MRRLFIESSSFSKKIDGEGTGALASVQTELLKNLEAGRVIQGTGGLRKLRVPDAGRGKGKRGGYRVIYLDLPDAKRTHLLAVYDKDEKEDISPAEKRILKALVERLKKEVR